MCLGLVWQRSHSFLSVEASFPPTPLPMVDLHFPNLTAAQRSLLGSLATLVRTWNDRVNLISRKGNAERLLSTRSDLVALT